MQLNDVKRAAQIQNVPIKNLKRWLENGYERKKGGRKTQDPLMELKLVEWINDFKKINDIMPTSKLIKKVAMKFSNVKNFKASKGWYEKFIHRYENKKILKTEEIRII